MKQILRIVHPSNQTRTHPMHLPSADHHISAWLDWVPLWGSKGQNSLAFAPGGFYMFDLAEQCLTSTLFTSSSSHPNSQALKKFGGQELQSTILPTWLLNSATALETASIKSETYPHLVPWWCEGVGATTSFTTHQSQESSLGPTIFLPLLFLGLGWNHNKVIHQSYHSPSQDGNWTIMDPWMRWVSRMGEISMASISFFPSLPATFMCQVFTAPSGSWWNSQGNCSRSQACLQDRRN